MGDEGTLSISENPGQCRVYAEGNLTPPTSRDVHPWQPWVDKGYLVPVPKDESKKEETAPKTLGEEMLAMYRSPPPVAFLLGVEPEKNLHQAHLLNFFDAVRGRGELTCPAEIGYETAVQVLKVHEALEAEGPLALGEEDFRV